MNKQDTNKNETRTDETAKAEELEIKVEKVSFKTGLRAGIHDSDRDTVG